ncbi:MAG: hypothetical protein BGO21_19230 [Dyadobacter sp. 50-39]|uniref:ankyrin repeat domain-containing protein n=1 Tax=Dyadobacter sp. 50-39 TaxID=1895756 RepID=UPI00095F5244|nr:ankyrin repeat domain-containing protein [Dyadobacter sp. 50-39]OJV14818.1 MAG: hypothetical protein BGO21_19230 [Dyadobacter sp. 50-39]
MNYLKTVTVANWVVIGVLFALVMLETLFPAKGGDAASGMGRVFYYLAIIILIILIVLNLLPYTWSRYTAFAMIAIPFLWIQFGSSVSRFGRGIVDMIEAKPFFEEKERDKMARAILDGKPDKLKKYIADYQPQLRKNAYGYPLLEMVVKSAVFEKDLDARIACINSLLDAGVPIRSENPSDQPVHYEAAEHGNPRILRLLLERGANANARTTEFGSGRPNVVPIIFAALDTSYGAYECTKALLDHGADPNAIMPHYGDRAKMSALLYAAERQYWSVCKLLIEKGADPRYTTPDGTSMQPFLEQGDSFYPEDAQALADFEAVRAIVEGPAAADR